MNKYLVIPRMQFQGANAQPAWWCVGPPGPMAFCGFGHAMATAIGQLDNYQGIGIVLNDWQLRAESFPKEFMISPHQHRGAALINGDDYAMGSKSLSGQPTVRGDGVVSVVLVFDEDARIDTEAVADFLRFGRIAGGSIETHRYDHKKGHIFSEWADVKRALRSGFAFIDRGDLIQRIGADDTSDPLDKFLEATRRFKKGQAAAALEIPELDAADVDVEEQEAEEGAGALASTSWLVPYCAGMRALTPFENRMWTREGVRHAFAEPLVGLGQLVSVRSADIPIWTNVQIDDDVFIVRQRAITSSPQGTENEEANV